jgi:hypothetical protein
MTILSKSEILFLQGQKQVSKSYEYKLKSIIKKKVSNLTNKEIPLLTTLFPNLNLTKFSKDIEKVDVEAPKKLHGPVKHCGLSSHRYRIQIPHFSHFKNSPFGHLYFFN